MFLLSDAFPFQNVRCRQDASKYQFMVTIETISNFFFVNDDYYEEIMTFNGVYYTTDDY